MNLIIWACRLIARTNLALAAGFLHLIHPFIHGTPLDSGALDSLLINLDLAVMTWGSDR